MKPAIVFDQEHHQYICQGNWTIHHIAELQQLIKKTKVITDANINGEKITALDSAGAWLLLNWQMTITKQPKLERFKGFSEQQSTLLELVSKRLEEEKPIPPPPHVSAIARIGEHTYDLWQGTKKYLNFVGQLTTEILRVVRKPSSFRWSEVSGIIYRNGYLALPIIGLLSLMIGVVLAYQMGLQLRNYGANVYIVDLIGIAILREFGPLLTAIIIAGRTGSAYTAQLGIMKINQEVDALNTMGVTPGEILLLPRVLGLLIALPLLSMWADIFGVLGGMIMANNMLHITWYDFLTRFPTVIKLKNLYLGIGKAPFFALIISSVGCYKGMQVTGSAESVGRNTTSSVVLAIFYIIIADAAFSVIFSKFKL